MRPAPTSPAIPRISPPRSWKLDVADPLAGQARDIEDHVSGRAVLWREHLLELPSDHEPDQFAAVGFAAVEGGDARAVLEHRDAVAEFGDLAHLVRHIDDRLARGLQPGDDFIEPADLEFLERRRWLVHDDDAGVLAQRLGDHHRLLLRRGQLAARPRHVEFRKADAVEQRPRPGFVRLAVDEAKPARLGPEHDVLGDGQAADHVQFLEDAGDAGFLRGKGA